MFGKKKEEVKEAEVVTPKPEETKQELVWELGRMPTEFQPVIVKGEEAITELEAIVKIMNLLEKVSKGLGVK